MNCKVNTANLECDFVLSCSNRRESVWFAIDSGRYYIQVYSSLASGCTGWYVNRCGKYWLKTTAKKSQNKANCKPVSNTMLCSHQCKWYYFWVLTCFYSCLLGYRVTTMISRCNLTSDWTVWKCVKIHTLWVPVIRLVTVIGLFVYFVNIHTQSFCRMRMHGKYCLRGFNCHLPLYY